jgi:DNA topoisomerase-2
MILVNGSEGIGTGYSTNIPCYNPDDIIANLKRLIDSDGQADLLRPMTPWYRGFTGQIVQEEDNRFISTGVWKRTANQIEISELPIGKWTQTYKEFLENLVETNQILDYKNGSDDKSVFFKVSFQKSVLDDLEARNLIEKTLKLTSSISTSNMHVFDEACRIRKINCAEEIIFRFYIVRRQHYHTRKDYLLKQLESEYFLLESKTRFIRLVIAEKIVVFNKKRDFVLEQIKAVEPPLVKVDDSWDYLLELKIYLLTQERIEELEARMQENALELEVLKSTSIQTMWTQELLKLKF